MSSLLHIGGWLAAAVSRGISYRVLISVSRSQDIDCRVALEALVNTTFSICRGFRFKFTDIYAWFLGIVGYTRRLELCYPISLLALANIDPIEQGMCDIIMIMDWLAKGENRNRPNSKTSKNG